MKTIKLNDDQFETLYNFVNERVEDVVERSIQYQDTEILEDWEDLLDVHTILEIAKWVNTKSIYQIKKLLEYVIS